MILHLLSLSNVSGVEMDRLCSDIRKEIVDRYQALIRARHRQRLKEKLDNYPINNYRRLIRGIVNDELIGLLNLELESGRIDEYYLFRILYIASCTRKLKIVKYFLENVSNFNYYRFDEPDVFDEILESGHPDIIRLLLSKVIPDDWHLDRAAERGQTEVVEILLQDGIVQVNQTLDIACYHGHTDIVRVLLKFISLSGNRPPLGEGLVEAVRNDSLEIIKLVGSLYPMDEAFIEAASCGRLRIIKYLLESRSWPRPILKTAIKRAYTYRNEEIIRILLPLLTGRICDLQIQEILKKFKRG